MNIKLNTPGIHHVAIRVANFARAREFYVDLLGFNPVIESEGFVIFMAGAVPVAMRGPESESPAADQFNPFRVGLDHIALTCTDETELQRVSKALEQANIWNTGIKVDEVLGKNYVAFKDPDGIKWEFYMA